MIEKQNPSLSVGYHGLESLILGLPSCRWLRIYVPSFTWVQRLNNDVPTISHNQGRHGPKLDHHPYTIGLWSGGGYFRGLSLSPVVQQEQVVNLTSRFRFALRVVNFKFSFPRKAQLWLRCHVQRLITVSFTLFCEGHWSVASFFLTSCEYVFDLTWLFSLSLQPIHVVFVWLKIIFQRQIFLFTKMSSFGSTNQVQSSRGFLLLPGMHCASNLLVGRCDVIIQLLLKCEKKERNIF